MKTTLLTLAVLACIVLPVRGRDTVRLADFGARPYSYMNCVPQLRAALDACKRENARVLLFEKGRYDLWPEGAERRDCFVSNTSSEEECPSKTKVFGLLIEDMEDLTIEGNGAELIFHGKMTMAAVIRSRRIALRGLAFDFERPAGSELTYARVDDRGVEVALHRDSRYEIVGGRIRLYGEGWRSEHIHCIEYDPQTQRFFHSDGWERLAGAEAVETAPGRVRFATPPDFRPQEGNTLTVRDIIRDQVGMLLLESRDVELEELAMRYMHGLGIVSQYSHNVTMRRVTCAPREGSGRLLASSADFMHFSGCSGRVRILGCRFAGAQDDPVNVHGTNLRIEAAPDDRTLRLRFMHPQSYGFDAFFAGDTVAFVRTPTMERIARAQVVAATRLSDREVELRLDRRIPQGVLPGRDCIENLTRTPEVEIRGCSFTRTSTRGTLVTTPRKVVIADNTYCKTGMSAILIEGDAENWYESGPVDDVLICGNRFVDCAWNGGPHRAVIALNPSNSEVDASRPVHRNVRIVDNTFRLSGNPALFAKSTEGLVFRDNLIEPEPPAEGLVGPLLLFDACKDAVVRDNRIRGDLRKVVECTRMRRGALSSDLP